MPSSPNYERLRELAALASVETTDPTVLAEIHTALTDLRETIEAIHRTPGLHGKVRSAIRSYLDKRTAMVDDYAYAVEFITGEYQKARAAIADAQAQFNLLKPELLTPAEERAAETASNISFQDIQLKAAQYYDGLIDKRNALREDAAGQILAETNTALEGLLTEIPTQKIHGDPDAPGSGGPRDSGGPSHGPSVGGGPNSRAPGYPSGGDPRSSHVPGRSSHWVDPTSPSPGPGGLVGRVIPNDPIHSIPPHGPGEPAPRLVPTPGGTLRPDPTPIVENPRWPDDVLNHPINAKLTPQGPIGGYLPPGITDIDDPRWRADYHHPALGGPPKPNGLSIVGGVLGTGAAATAATRTATSIVTGINAGATPYVPGHPMAPGTTGAAPTRGGTLRPATATGTGTPGHTTRPTTPGMWGTPPGGAPGRDEQDKKRSLVGYQVTRINDDPPTVDPSHFAAGDTTTLTPAPPPEDDRW